MGSWEVRLGASSLIEFVWRVIFLKSYLLKDFLHYKWQLSLAVAQQLVIEKNPFSAF